MGMQISSLRFDDFRNYDRYELENIGDLTIFIGRNGVGKTNLLEGIHLLTTGSSFRHSQIGQIVREGAPSARLEADVSDGNRALELSLHLETGKKRYAVNGKAKQIADMKGMLPAVSFTPDDLQLAKGSSSVKRMALDDLGSQLSKSYYIVRRDYEKSLRYKNRLLKEEAPKPLVEAMNETLLTCATQLYCFRHALQRRLAPLVEARYREIAKSAETFGISYLSSWDYLNNGEKDFKIAGYDGGMPDKARVNECLREALERYLDEEYARRRCLVGPHNDKITFYLDGKDASDFASQGQQRSIVLSWKLSEVEQVRQTVGTNPVLLLDDVMSELDSHRRDMLVTVVGNDVQTFMTATDESSFNGELLGRARVVKLER